MKTPLASLFFTFGNPASMPFHQSWMLWPMGHTNTAIPPKDLLPTHSGEAKKKVMHRFRVKPTKLANWVMRPSHGSPVVYREDLAMNGQPCKEAAFRLRLRLPQFSDSEWRVSALELTKINRGRQVLVILRPSSSNRVRLGHQLHLLYKCPKARWTASVELD